MPRRIKAQPPLVGSQDPIRIVSREEDARKSDGADSARERDKGPRYAFLFRNDAFLVFLCSLNLEGLGKSFDELDL